MAKPILDDDLWNVVEPLLPPPKRRRFRYPGRKPVPHRAALTGILFVLRTGIPWEYLPQELGCGSGMTCWRRLRTWQRRGVWDKLHRVLLERLQEADQIDWSRAAVDSSSLRAVGGATKRAPILRIGGKKARNTTSLRTRTAFPSRFASPVPTATMSPN
jgi:transposase